MKLGSGEQFAALAAPLDTEFESHELTFSDRDGKRTVIPFGQPTEPAPASALARTQPLELSWTRYEGPKGGTGWVSDTGEVRYQSEKPSDADGGEQGPESVFAHPDFAHIPEHTSPAEARDHAQIRADAHAQAEATGIDPAELHRLAAGRLHRDLADLASHPSTWTAARHLQNHEAQEHVLRLGAEASANRAKAARAEEAGHSAAAAGFRKIGHPDLAAGREGLAQHAERRAVGHEQSAREALAKADQHKAAADKIRAGEAPKIASANKRTLLAGAYADAHRDLTHGKEAREEAAEFANTYFDEEKPAKRAARYLEAYSDGALDADLLDADTRAAIVEDLAHVPVAKLADYASREIGAPGIESAEHQIAVAAVNAVAAQKPPTPLAFDGSDPDKYVLVTPDNAGEDEYAGLQAAARLLPGVKAPLAGAMLVKASSPLGKIATARNAGEELGGSESNLFAALKTGFQLPVEHVPASARDYGGTSGSKGSGEYSPEEGWDANAVPVYKRVNEGWFVRLNPGLNGDDPGYELVKSADAPPLARLPDVYWSDLDAENPGATDEAVERAERRESKRNEEGATQKKDLQALRREIKQKRSEAGKLRTAWNQALKGVPEDERPDEPDWDAVDASLLGSNFEHDSRESQVADVQQVHSDYDDHVQNLKYEVEGAKEHAANHRANAAASAKAQEEWESLLDGVPEEDRPEEPDWRDTLGGDQGSHAKFLQENLELAREAAEQHGTAHNEAAEQHRAEWKAADTKVREKLAESAYAKKIADADDALNDTINERLLGDGDNHFGRKFTLDRDDHPDGEAGDAGHAALERVQETLDNLENDTSTPDHEDGPDHDDYTFDETTELPDREDFDTPEDRAIHFEQSTQEHRDRADELAESVPKHYTETLIRSDAWRKEMREHLEQVQKAAADALKVDGGYSAEDRASLEELARRVADLLAKAQPHKETPATELSATPDPVAPVAVPPELRPVAEQTGGRLMRMRKAKLAQLLALAMIRRQLQAREGGNPRSAARPLGQLANLANDPEQVSALVGLPPIGGTELSWQPYVGKRGQRAGTQVGWYNPDSREVRYQKAKPGEGAERLRGRQASGSAGLAITHKVVEGTASAEDLGELVDHLRVMTVPRLKNVAVMLEKSLGGLKRRDKMVEALLGHVGGLTAADGTKSDGSKAVAPTATPFTAPPAPESQKIEPAADDGKTKAQEPVTEAPPATEPPSQPALDDAVLGYLKSNPKATLNDIQKAIAPDVKYDRNAPLSHPVNAALKSLRDKGAIESHGNWGEPRFSAVAPKQATEPAPATPAPRTPRGYGTGAADANPTEEEFEAASRPYRPKVPAQPDPAKAATPKQIEQDIRAEIATMVDRGEAPEDGNQLAQKVRERLGTKYDQSAVEGSIEKLTASGALGQIQNAAEISKRARDEGADVNDPNWFIRSQQPDIANGWRNDDTIEHNGKQLRLSSDLTKRRKDGLAAGNVIARDKDGYPVAIPLGQLPQYKRPTDSAPPASAPPAGAVASPGMSDPTPAQPAPAPKVTDRGNLDSIKEATDRALGIKPPEKLPEAPKKGDYGAYLRAAAGDPAKFAELEKLTPLPTLDRNELLSAVAEVYGPTVHAEVKKKSKQGIVALLKGSQIDSSPSGDNNPPTPPTGGGGSGGGGMEEPKGPRTVHRIESFRGSYRDEERLKKELGAAYDEAAFGSVVPDDKIEQARAAGFVVQPYEVEPPPPLPPEARDALAKYGLDPEKFAPKHLHDKDYERIVSDLSRKHPLNLRTVANRASDPLVREAINRRLAEVEADPATDALETPYTTYTPAGKAKETKATWGEIKTWRATPGRTHFVPGSTAKWDADRERRVGGGPLAKGTVVPGAGVVADHREIGGQHEYLLRPFSKKEKAEDDARQAAAAAEAKRVRDAMWDR